MGEDLIWLLHLQISFRDTVANPEPYACYTSTLALNHTQPLVFETQSHCSPESWYLMSPVSASQGLELQTCAIIPSWFHSAPLMPSVPNVSPFNCIKEPL